MKIKGSNYRPVSGAILACLSTVAFSQSSISGAPTTGGSTGFSTTSVVGATSGAGTPPAKEAEGAGNQGREWVIKPRVTLTETLSDNVNVNRVNNGKQSDLITEIAPGIRVEAKTAKLKAYLDYTLRGQFYAKEPDYNRSQNSLNTFGTLEAIDNWFFVDFSGFITQQTISAFGAQSTSASTINNNSTETASYRISPYIRGQMGGLVDYLLRYNLSTTRSDASIVSDTNISEWVGQLRGSTPFQKLKWTIDTSQQSTDYSRGRDTDAERIRAMLTYSVLPQLRFSLSGGQERNNYASLNHETNSTNGYGFDWNPTERTQISGFRNVVSLAMAITSVSVTAFREAVSVFLTRVMFQFCQISSHQPDWVRSTIFITRFIQISNPTLAWIRRLKTQLLPMQSTPCLPKAVFLQILRLQAVFCQLVPQSSAARI
ncbi:MAG: TIGR03016 family PEP-CTERM system-associated outer membrane protein [Dechloromonas sp.]|uniref:TIGR03016 family PEP-CTERM system-associated outer membrane protein n=1 Tax=Candidatus Dechloromonas phosphorivorans TaxID=2899244 RepID=A0A935K3D2_9RHOO|nr:TIGR03016 family PEP-CTERM system-associated outer membrane protein [Candidatus Dechloromonas phosphorivorans]